MAIFCTFMPLLLIAEGIKRIGASRFALLNTSGPVITLFLCYIILQETMTYQQIIGSMVIIGILYMAEKRNDIYKKNKITAEIEGDPATTSPKTTRMY